MASEKPAAAESPRGPAATQDVPVPGSDVQGNNAKPATQLSDGLVNHVTTLKHRYLVRKPVVRQYLHAGHFYEADAAKEPSRFELFFDLVVVAMLHQLGERVAEDYHGLTLALFLVIYGPIYSVWNDVRSFVNVSGVDDVVQRLVILLYMGLLIGYAANAASLRLPSQLDVEADQSVSEEGIQAIQRLAAAAESVETVAYATLQATIAFLLVAKLTRMVQQLIYAVWLPRFRPAFLWSALTRLVSMGIYLPLIWVRNETVFWVLMGYGAVHEFGLAVVGKALVRWEEQNPKWREREEGAYRPALNLDHYIERNALFLVLVLGESLLKIIYLAQGDSIGLSGQFGRAVLALICAFCLCNLVFDMDASHTYIHALRRHWFSSTLYTHMIYPLSSSIILWASSLHAMVPDEEVSGGAQWYFSGGLATALVFLAFAGWLHQSMDVPGSALIPRSIRLGLRVLWAIILILLPLSDMLKDTTSLLAVSACLLLILVAVEIIGKVGAQSQDFKTAPNGIRLEDLTDTERGEEDVGIEGGLTEIERQAIPLKQRLAWSA